ILQRPGREQVTEERVAAVLAVVARVAVLGVGAAHALGTLLVALLGLRRFLGDLDGHAGDLGVPVLNLGEGLDLLGQLAGLLALLLHGAELVDGQVAALILRTLLESLDGGAQSHVLLALRLEVRVHGALPESNGTVVRVASEAPGCRLPGGNPRGRRRERGAEVSGSRYRGAGVERAVVLNQCSRSLRKTYETAGRTGSDAMICRARSAFGVSTAPQVQRAASS